jgi:hypothetical protein
MEERVAVTPRRRLFERAREWAMLYLAARAGAHGVRGEERERMLVVAPILSEV